MPILCACWPLLRCWPPRRPLASHLARANIAADIVVLPGPDHTTAQAAESLGLGADDSRVAKSVVFFVDGSPVLCVVRGCDRVSLLRLQELCEASSARLATPAEAEAATGFKPGTIGPLSPAMLPSVRIVMDERLLSAPSPVFAGAGTPGEHLRISPAELRRASGAIVARLVETPRSVARGQAPPPLDGLVSSGSPGSRGGVWTEQPAVPESASSLATTPLEERDCLSGELCEPQDIYAECSPQDVYAECSPHDVRTGTPRKVGADVCRVLRLNALSEDETVEIEVRESPEAAVAPATHPMATINLAPRPHRHPRPHSCPRPNTRPLTLALGQVLRVRRQGKLLVFASVRERCATAPAIGGRTGRPRVEQLIAGKSLVAEAGEERAAALIRHLKPGAVFVARGRVQRNPREAEASQPTTADLVACSLRLLVESTPGTAPAPPWPCPTPQHKVAHDTATPPPTAAAAAAAAAATAATTEATGATEAVAGAAGAAETVSGASLLGTMRVRLIAEAAGVGELCAAIEAWCCAAERPLVGLDLEWRPRRFAGAAAVTVAAASGGETVAAAAAASDGEAAPLPVALLQLASRSEVFLVDVQALSRASDAAALLAQLSGGMARLLQCASVTKLGFACRGDLERLEMALPGCTADTAGLVDVQPLVRVGLGRRKGSPVGLQQACAALLGLQLDKGQQVSDWELRPLSEAQLAYAALDAAVLPPLYDAAMQQQQQQQQLTALPPRPAPSRALPLPRHGEEAEEKAASAARAAESGPPPDGARRRWRQDFVFVSTGDAHGEPSRATPTGAMPPPPMPRQLSLPVEALLHRWLGKSTGGRADIVQLCASLSDGRSTAADLLRWGDEAGRCGAITQWADGACLYVNAGRYRNGPSARYRNRFWREADGSVLASWFPGRGHSVTGVAVTALLSGMPLLLFCRRGPTHDYLLCGRLEPVALALPEGDEAEAASAEASVPSVLWTTAAAAGEPPSQAAHVVFRLLDAAALQTPGEDVLDQVLGGRALEAERPKHYVAETTVGPATHGAGVVVS